MEYLILLLAKTLYFALPGALGNTAPIFIAKVPVLKAWNRPLDGNHTFRGKRIFGDHKTVRGFLAGGITGVIVIFLQVLLHMAFTELRAIEILDYTRPDILAVGAALGFGALTGDAIKSFFKRQIGKRPGVPWFPFDQLDMVAGMIVCTLPFFIPPTDVIITGIVVAPGIHFSSNVLGFLLGLKKVWW